MSLLAKTWKPDDMRRVFEQVKDLTAAEAEQVFRRSGGDADKVEDLVQQAVIGLFSMKV